MWADCPGTELIGVALKLRQRMKISPSCARVVQNTLNLAISCRYFVEDGKEMYKKHNARAEVLFLLIKPIVLCRRRRRRRRRCLSFLLC